MRLMASLMKASITDTNTATDVSIKCISPSILAIDYNHSMLQYYIKPLLYIFLIGFLKIEQQLNVSKL